jgi:hypothetical protein
VGYRGKVEEQAEARRLRAGGRTLLEIADELGVSKSSVSLWVRDVPLPPRPARRSGPRRRAPNALQRRKQDEIDALLEEGRRRIGHLSEKEFLVAGAALYAGEGAKTGNTVKLANSDPRMVAFFCAWLRHHFEIDERRLRISLYLHQGLDLDAAIAFWSAVTQIPPTQFTKPYRAVPDPTIRRSKHPRGCASVVYSSTSVHRAVMGLVQALLSCDLRVPSGVAQSAEHPAVNRQVESSSLSPGALTPAGGGSSVVRAPDS